MNDNLPRAVWEGEFQLFGVTLRCAVLDNGQRVIRAEDVEAMFEAMGRDAEYNAAEAEKFMRWQRGLARETRQ